MEPKRLKASLQLAKMRYDSNPSETNEAIYEQALEAYEDSLQKAEVEKIEQVSGDSQNPDVPEDIAKSGVMSGAFEAIAKAVKPAAEKSVVDPIAENSEPISESENEQKKTELDDQPLS